MGCASSVQFDDNNYMNDYNYVNKAIRIYKRHQIKINYNYLGLHYYYRPIIPQIKKFKKYGHIFVQCEHCESKEILILSNRIANSEGNFNFIMVTKFEKPRYVYYKKK